MSSNTIDPKTLKALQQCHFPEGFELPHSLPDLLHIADICLQQFINGLYHKLIEENEGHAPSEADLDLYATKTIDQATGIVHFYWRDTALIEFTPHGFAGPTEDGGSAKWRRSEVAILSGQAKIVDASAN